MESCLYEQACGSKGFPGKSFSHEQALKPQLRWLHLPRAPLREHRCNKAERSWSYESPGVHSTSPAGCKWRLLAGTGGRQCHPRHSRSPQELLRYQLAHVGGSHGRSRQSTAGKSAGGRRHPWLRPSRTTPPGLVARPFWAEGERARTRTRGTCFSDGNSAAGCVVKLLGSC